MKKLSTYTQVALAVAAVCASSVVVANGYGGGDVDYSNSTSVEIDKKVEMKRKVNIEGDVEVVGLINVQASSAALVSQSQTSKYNDVTNDIVKNTAMAGSEALREASGNIGLNITAGDNNQQDNSAALSAVDADFVFADAEIISNQKASTNITRNNATVNTAGLTGDVLYRASGNIAANISAGASNLQANSLAASVNSGTMAEADVSSLQSGTNNVTRNNGAYFTVYDRTRVRLSGTMTGTTESSGSGSYSGNASGTTAGQSDQIGNLYIDNWDNNPGDSPVHGTSVPGPTGHSDWDSEAQGAQDLNNDGGALALNNDGTYSGSEAGDIGFSELGTVELSGSFTGVVNNTQTVFVAHENNAGISGNALRGASGNIGVNIAAGSNNLQGNHLSIAAGTGLSLPGGE
jgi:hypothetical protein